MKKSELAGRMPSVTEVLRRASARIEELEAEVDSLRQAAKIHHIRAECGCPVVQQAGVLHFEECEHHVSEGCVTCQVQAEHEAALRGDDGE